MTRGHGAVAAAALAALLAGPPASAGEPPAPLGLCPAPAERLDGYARLLCDGEASLHAGELGAALRHFRAAAETPRIDASNELAWAGLAVAHCRGREFDAGRRWAAYFEQARQLWHGALDCDGAAAAAQRLDPFVRERMCGERLTTDYALLRLESQAAFAAALRARLQRAADAVAGACTSAGAKPPAVKAAAGKPTAKRRVTDPAKSKSTKRPRAG